MNVTVCKESLAKYYDHLSDHYASRYYKLVPKDAYINQAFSYLKKSNPITIEIGSGSGCDAHRITQHTSNYLGLDLSAKMVRLSRQRVPEAKFICADAESYSFPLQVDIFFAFASLFHLCRSNLRKLLRRFNACLEPEGVIVITLKEGDYHSTINYQNNIEVKTFLYSPVDIKKMVPKNLKIIYQDTQMFNDQKWLCFFLQKSSLQKK